MGDSALERRIEAAELLCCPRCGGDLTMRVDGAACAGCRQEFSVDHGIPMLYWSGDWEFQGADVTEVVKTFYETNPFPNYDELDSAGSLIEKAERSGFVRLLGEQIPLGTKILEVGCGTGQLTNYLGILDRTVYGADMCLNSLRLANEFKERNLIGGSHFVQMNLFRPAFRKKSFDLVYCTGVLHHTADPYAGFRSIASLVRPKGYIVIGLYHRFGRILNDARRMFFQASGDRGQFIDSRLRNGSGLTGAQRQAWFADQYKHPHESKHTVTQLLGWLEGAGFEFVKSIPKTKAFSEFRAEERLFQREPPGHWLERRLVELGMVVTNYKEGGYFMVIGRKKA